MIERCSRRGLMLLPALLAAACSGKDPGGASSATNFSTCSADAECLQYVGGAACDDQGYCVDARGARLDAQTPRLPRAGREATDTPDAAVPDAANAQGGSGAEQVAAGQGGAASLTAGSGGAGSQAAGSGGQPPLEPRALCACSSQDIKMPLTSYDAPAHQLPDKIVFKFANGSRVRRVDGRFVVDPAGRSEQDLAELACAGLDFASADAAMESVNVLLGGLPTVTVQEESGTSWEAIDDLRDFEGLHCVSAGSEALADLNNWYNLTLDVKVGPYLMKSFDDNPLITHAYYGPMYSEPATP
jgi:hypothetical protein